jgi:hypothetical protein
MSHDTSSCVSGQTTDFSSWGDTGKAFNYDLRAPVFSGNIFIVFSGQAGATVGYFIIGYFD